MGRTPEPEGAAIIAGTFYVLSFRRDSRPTIRAVLFEWLVAVLEQLVQQFDGAVQVAVIDAGLGLFQFACMAGVRQGQIRHSAVQAPTTGRHREFVEKVVIQRLCVRFGDPLELGFVQRRLVRHFEHIGQDVQVRGEFRLMVRELFGDSAGSGAWSKGLIRSQLESIDRSSRFNWNSSLAAAAGGCATAGGDDGRCDGQGSDSAQFRITVTNLLKFLRVEPGVTQAVFLGFIGGHVTLSAQDFQQLHGQIGAMRFLDQASRNKPAASEKRP